MNELKIAKKSLTETLLSLYDEREAANMLKYYFTDKFTTEQQQNEEYMVTEITKDILRFKSFEPYQYIVEKAFFYNRFYYVDHRVLIPRPETEELVSLVLDHLAETPNEKLSVLDIGSGSGCIGLTIALESKHHSELSLTLVDISEEALQVAQRNSHENNITPLTMKLDFLDEKQWTKIPKSNIIVSNPPYIDLMEMKEMLPNVLDFEPSLALFADPPVVFYKAIARFAAFQNINSKIFCECNPIYIHETQKAFEENGCQDIEIILDLQGKQRFIRANYTPNLT
ncbi:MAG TPA: HemK/PrmC family methyltransferase [Saprospiraceae bacterium]|nr:HemK/PrmC family methyltransferase [Saprospiraceae bacterium]HPN71258.1 HemK/PrmC family methyltransferase [Saprospiraceae bacterium]